VQRFGGVLDLNVHLHALVLDGVLTQEADSSSPAASRRRSMPIRTRSGCLEPACRATGT
jgi:hypothetical protein